MAESIYLLPSERCMRVLAIHLHQELHSAGTNRNNTHPKTVVFVQSLSCVQLFDPTDCSTPGFPVLHHLPGAQTHAHRVGDAIPPSHPLLSPSPPAFNLSHGNSGCLLCWPREVQSSIRVAKESWGFLSSDCRANRPHLGFCPEANVPLQG